MPHGISGAGICRKASQPESINRFNIRLRGRAHPFTLFPSASSEVFNGPLEEFDGLFRLDSGTTIPPVFCPTLTRKKEVISCLVQVP